MIYSALSNEFLRNGYSLIGAFFILSFHLG